MTERRTPPDDLTVDEAIQQYLRRLRRDKNESTVRTYRLDLRQFKQWCDGEDIEQISMLTGYDFELYQDDRAADLSPISLEKQMMLLKRFINFCEDIELVEPGLADAVHVPQADPDDRVSKEKLETEDARAQLQFFRERSNGLYGTKWHAALEVLWHTGARIGGLRALDLQDYDSDDLVLSFRHRPKTGTPLKNKRNGERDVGILPAVADALDEYIAEHRNNKHDEHSRAPLFTTRMKMARPSHNGLRCWVYQATQPCWHTDDPCPHDRKRDTCDWTQSSKSSKCPSSRSPHAIRTGSITFHRDQGFDPEDTARRVNASLRTIQRHYDQPSRRQELEERRRPQLTKLTLEDTENDN
ncbi:Phage integrase, N-terminal SAM-like domain [Halovenus aranensis]|uniref:Phage integrase, N-terminal SAM-like domain n=1 Tax=Halovenus aranensis TaxID=890420 RepID=A0A1G8V9Y5_9EURY|nr:site-specific integrase [Halovenus aranensis]SDJ62813.1 Phage integrase, N-terminal SAM-like domain [Halovenus aranensis]